MYKTISLSIAFLSLCCTSLIQIQPSNAMTADEFLRMMGVLGRYADDINRTFPSNNQPIDIPQPNPEDLPPSQADEEQEALNN